MADTLNPAERSRQMGLVRSKDTRPELLVRRWLHARGYRYRLHVRALPGQPDIVFASRRKVVFVHGCFWHRHENCKLARLPKSRLEFWGPKLEANVTRDQKKIDELRSMGWGVLVVWECELRDIGALGARMIRFLEDTNDEGSGALRGCGRACTRGQPRRL